MVNAVQALSSGVSSAALSARASAASAALTVEPEVTTESVQAADPTATALAQAYRYNSFEFSYRQDFGKIVLLRQKPDTGELVQQFPSEYYLRKYADSQRVARVAVEAGKTSSPANSNTDAVSGDVAAAVAGGTSAGGSVSVEAAPAIAPAPALPSGTGAAAPASSSSGSVNVTV